MALSLRALRDRLLAGLLGDAEQTEAVRPMLMLDMLSDWLPYRVYDPASRLYVNARSKGFVLGVTPLIGADERTGEILGAFFSEGLPAGACLQVLHLASPRISRIVAPWFAPRYEQGGVYEAIARHRAKKLYSMVWKSGASDAPFHARAHQVVISLGVPASKAISNEELMRVAAGGEEPRRTNALKAAEVARIYAVYEKLKRDRKAIDFGDLVALPVELFETRPEIAAQIGGLSGSEPIVRAAGINLKDRLFGWLLGRKT